MTADRLRLRAIIASKAATNNSAPTEAYVANRLWKEPLTPIVGVGDAPHKAH